MDPSLYLLGIPALLLLFFLGRAVVLWYWRTNESVALLRDISDSLRIQRGAPPLPVPRAWYKK